MKTAVITGSTRGLGFEMARRLRGRGWNIVINGVSAPRLGSAEAALKKVRGSGRVESFRASVAVPEEIEALAAFAGERFGTVDLWINNAGVNQPMKAMWELTADEINALMDIDLRGTIMGSLAAVRLMEGQPDGGFIYNVEGYGSNDAMMLGLNMYGTSKAAARFMTAGFVKRELI